MLFDVCQLGIFHRKVLTILAMTGCFAIYFDFRLGYCIALFSFEQTQAYWRGVPLFVYVLDQPLERNFVKKICSSRVGCLTGRWGEALTPLIFGCMQKIFLVSFFLSLAASHDFLWHHGLWVANRDSYQNTRNTQSRFVSLVPDVSWNLRI